MSSKKRNELYPIERSPFYRMGRGIDLARLLGLTPKDLTRLIVQRSILYRFQQKEINGKPRSLAVPVWEMRRVHERIQSLLNRIELSEYLLSPRTGKTVIDNALVHLDSNVVVKLDVKQFYPSTTDEHVFQFFRHRMRMADDVAGRLTKLCTVNNKVPMGSPLSPILCALVHDDMFGKATNLLAKQRMSTSLWVDDLTTSGESLSKSGLRSVRRLVNSKRMTTHKAAKSTANKGLVVTGIFVKNGELAPSNKSHVKMRDTLNALKVADNDVERLQVMRSLVGQINHFLQVYRDNSDMTERLRKRLAWLHSFRRRIEAGGVVTLSEMNASMPANDDALPWDEPV